MNRKRETGFTFIEIVAFILVIGIIAVAMLTGLNQSQRYINQPDQILMSQYLANARMQIIMMNRAVNGYSSLTDPCTTTPALAICTPLSTYAADNGMSVATPAISGSNPKLISITVTGTRNVVLQSRVYNYGNN